MGGDGQMKNKTPKGVFVYITKAGEITDKGVVDHMLKNEDAITEQLVKAGVIRIIEVVRKKPAL